MLYLNKKELECMGARWKEQLSVIHTTLQLLKDKDVVQPVKPYLRFRNLTNRIIAMPAFIGGKVPMAGIKWIASFPGNIEKGLLRAHSVTILNDADTGVPLCMINTALISGIRTAAVSGVLLDAYLREHPEKNSLRVGITSFGPIGRLHLQMLADIAADRQLTVCLYDLHGVDATAIPAGMQGKVSICHDWESAYKDADIFIACTVSARPYVNLAPKPGSLQLNVSLRDYVPEFRKWADMVIVDDWEEVCRENTDIENMHRLTGLRQEDTVTLADVVCDRLLAGRPPQDVIMFNPMGMAIFDIAVASNYYHLAMKEKAGILLED